MSLKTRIPAVRGRERAEPQRPLNELRVARVLRALQDRPQLRASQLARIVGVSPNYLERLFKQHVGTSIREYSLELRLDRARELLVTTFQSVKEIRNAAGIPDASNFTRLFKKRFGETPSRYRKSGMQALTNK